MEDLAWMDLEAVDIGCLSIHNSVLMLETQVKPGWKGFVTFHLSSLTPPLEKQKINTKLF